jgi:hypothetical protein
MNSDDSELDRPKLEPNSDKIDDTKDTDSATDTGGGISTGGTLFILLVVIIVATFGIVILMHRRGNISFGHRLDTFLGPTHAASSIG